MKHVCVWLIRFYQKFLSPLKRNPSCRFTPTCSAYALEAFRTRGFIVGILLTFYRILRCNPFSCGGYDPVPKKGEKCNPMKRYSNIDTTGDNSDSEESSDESTSE